MDRLVVRDLGQDGVERSSAGVVDLLDAKEGLRSCLVLDEAFGTDDYVDVAPEGLLELIGGLTQPHFLREAKGGYTDLLHLLPESFHRVAYLVAYLVKDRLRRRCRRKCR